MGAPHQALLGLGGAVAGVGLPVTDTVTRADNVSSPGVTDTGHTWVVPASSGTWGVNTNKLYLPTGANRSLVYVETGVADCTIQCSMYTAGGGGDTRRYGLMFRYVDVNNYFYFYWLASGALRCFKFVAGSATQLDTRNLTPTEGNILKVILSGNSIQLFHNGSSLTTLTESFNNTATKHGLYWEVGGNAANTARWDDFSIV